MLVAVYVKGNKFRAISAPNTGGNTFSIHLMWGDSTGYNMYESLENDIARIGIKTTITSCNSLRERWEDDLSKEQALKKIHLFKQRMIKEQFKRLGTYEE